MDETTLATIKSLDKNMTKMLEILERMEKGSGPPSTSFKDIFSRMIESVEGVTPSLSVIRSHLENFMGDLEKTLEKAEDEISRREQEDEDALPEVEAVEEAPDTDMLNFLDENWWPFTAWVREYDILDGANKSLRDAIGYYMEKRPRHKEIPVDAFGHPRKGMSE